MLFFVVFLLMMCKLAMVYIKLQGCVTCCASWVTVWECRMGIPKPRLAMRTSGIAGKSQVWCSWHVLDRKSVV